MPIETKNGLFAAIAAPLFWLSGLPAHAQTPAANPTSAPRAIERMDHISVEAVGRGSPVVLVPGLSSPRETWAGFVPQLAASHRVYLVQINGFGGDDPGANLRPGLLDGVVADLDRYMTAHRLEGAPLVGHSMGGLVGLMLSKAHPNDVGRLMIVDTLPWYGMLFGPTATLEMVEPQARAMRAQAAASYGKPADPAAGDQIAAALALNPKSRETVASWVGRADPRVSGEAAYEDFTTDLRPDMAGIATPITLLYPTAPSRPAAVVDPVYHDAYAAAPHVTYVPVANSGHFIMLDQPQAFAAALTSFLESHG